jgi:hypothetical protein
MSKQLKAPHPDGNFHYNVPDPEAWFSMYPEVQISKDFRDAVLMWTFICMHIMSQAETAPKKSELPSGSFMQQQKVTCGR